jgi:hypothetical protein
MPRERSTWNVNAIAKRAGMKVADPYLMNQDHVNQQPSADQYVIGGPSDFAEDIHPSNGTWEAEYAGGQVKRNEIGMPEMRSDTFNHPEKTASEEVITKKAALCVAIARRILPKTASAAELEDQSYSFMYLPDAEVMATYTRLAADEQEEQEEQDQGSQGQSQQKQAGQIPPQFLENIKKKKEEKEDDDEKSEATDKKAALCVAIARKILPKTASAAEVENQSYSFMYLPDAELMSTYTRLAADEQGQESQQGQGQQKQAQQDQGQQDQGQAQQKQAQQDQGQQDQGQGQQKQAEMQQQAMQQQLAQLIQQAQQIQQQLAQAQQVQTQQQQAGQQQQQAQMQQQSQAQQVAQAVQQAIAQGQDPVQAAQQCLGQSQQQVGSEIDQMLAEQGQIEPVADMDIQLDTPSMDVGEAQLTSEEDDALRQLFANTEYRNAQEAAGQGQEDQGQGQAQQKQAHVVRTASMRTVGTRPTAGVSQIGGVPSNVSAGRDLSRIWNSAPDVREAFGMRTD